MGLSYPSSESFLMERIQNLCGKALIYNLSNSKFGRALFVQRSSLSNEGKDVLIHIRFNNIVHHF